MIFEDPSSKRWKLTIAVFACIVIIAVILIVNFVYSILVNSPLLPLSVINPNRGKYVSNTTSTGENTSEVVISTVNPTPTTKPTPLPNSFPSKDLERPFKGTFVRSAFMLQDDPVSVADMKKHINEIDIIFPDWLIFVNGKVEINETIYADLLTYLKSQKAMIFPRLANTDIDGNWFGEDFGKFIKSSENRTQLSLLIVNTLKKYDLKGINVDVEEISPESGNDYLEFLYELRQFMHRDGLYLTVDVPMNDESYDYEAIGQIADFVIVMAYDEHYPSGVSGAIAGFDWFNEGIKDMSLRIPKDKLIIGTGQYSYEWNTTLKTSAAVLSFDETMLLAKDVGADIQTDDQNINSYFSYKDDLNQLHNVWMLDAISMWNQLQAIHKSDLAGVSLWRLGSEDPTIWGFYGLRDSSGFSPQSLSKVSTLNFVGYDGRGEILKVTATPVEGRRILSIEKNIIEYTDYDKLPTNYQVRAFGHNDKKNIALTFDDGPNKIYTNEILDILKANKITATFFIVGDQAQRNVRVLKRIYNEGNLIGNHTFNHPDLSQMSDENVRLELNSVQRFSEAVLGRQMLLFRASYAVDSNPSTPSELESIYTAGQMGYVFVGADIDSKDYLKPGVDKIVQNIQVQLMDSGSNIIVMHDGGGNRQQTVDALKILIPLLKKEGYTFVNINDLLGVPKESLMPNISFKENITVWADKVWNFIINWGWDAIVILFMISTVISILRILLLGSLVLKSNKKRRIYNEDDDFSPFVSILIPAYNEEKVIEKTIQAVLKSNYNNYEILVIDDGSTDKTAGIVKKYILSYPQIRLLTKPNAGKYSALNLGFKEAHSEYVITIDADTMLLPNTIRNLIIPMQDENIDAVCGNVMVGNVRNILTGFQAAEYITSQNYDRRAFDELNCISVVPGATGAWKKSKVLEAGGYSSMTLTEDADLTLTMIEKGAKIIYMPSARSVTESPETNRALYKQRFRWSFGTFQCLWKHRRSFFKGTLGWIALPNMFIFQVIFPIISPLGDLVLILSLFRGDMQAILAGYLLFLLMDFAGSLMAFILDKSPKRYLWLVVIQRFYYRQFMYVVAYKAIISVFKGRRYRWNKLARTSSVDINSNENRKL